MDFKLYEISEMYRQALDEIQVDPDTGVVTGFEEVQKLSGEFDSKAEAIACYIKELQAFSDSVKAEMDGLKKRAESAKKTADRLKEYLGQQMDGADKDKIKTPRVSISWRKSTSCEILDASEVPEKYCTVEVKPSKSAITQAIKDGETVPGAALVENRKLQIR